jgi:glutamate--cysteine ligase catalytic subunit
MILIRMLEATPGQPYGDGLEDLLSVEANMILRRKCIQQFLLPEEQIFTLPCYPRMGTPNFTLPSYAPSPNGAISRFDLKAENRKI